MNAWRIIVIGAGNLGCRHIQAIAGVEHPVSISVVDPSEASIQHTKDVLGSTRAAVDYHQDFSDLSGAYDVAVIATSSGARKNVFTSLLQKVSIRYCIFEKVLFQGLADYDEVQGLLSEKLIKAWVNCPRRMYPGWQTVKNELSDYHGEYRLQVVGGCWGLACNSIHYLDALSWLTGDCDTFRFDMSELEARVVPSKRSGYVEFLGRLQARSEHCPDVSMLSHESTTAYPALDLYTDVAHYHIEEFSQHAYRATEKTNWSFEPFDFPIFYQSQLTGKVVELLMTTGQCPLTPYSRSAELHKPYVQAFLQAYREITGKDEKLCPIT